MDTRILEDLGFTNAEIRVYLTLLELGNATAGPIIEKSGLQNSVVHMTLNKLVNAGFASFIKEGQRNHYQAANPKHIIEYIDEKKKKFEEILPELLAKQQNAEKKSEVVTFRGVKGIRELLYELLEAGGKEHNTMGSPKEGLMMGDTFWLNYHKKRSSLGIKARLIFNESLKSWKAETKYPKAEVRYTNKGFEPLTETIIRNDTIAVILWTEIPLGILFHSSAAAASYNVFFEVMWKQADKNPKSQ